MHASQKHFKIHKYPVTPKFLKDRFFLYHPFINATLNAYGSTRASTGPRSETFTGIQKLRLLNNNPSLLETTISEVLMEPNSDLWYRRQKRTNWHEVHFDDPRLLSLFPKSNQREVMALNAGPYLVRKAQGYIPGLSARYQTRLKARKQFLRNRKENSAGVQTDNFDSKQTFQS